MPEQLQDIESLPNHRLSEIIEKAMDNWGKEGAGEWVYFYGDGGGPHWFANEDILNESP